MKTNSAMLWKKNIGKILFRMSIRNIFCFFLLKKNDLYSQSNMKWWLKLDHCKWHKAGGGILRKTKWSNQRSIEWTLSKVPNIIYNQFDFGKLIYNN